MMRLISSLAALALLVGLPAHARAQDAGQPQPLPSIAASSPAAGATEGPVMAANAAAPADQVVGDKKPDDVHPLPPHTGFATLVKDTVGDFKAWPQRESTWVI